MVISTTLVLISVLIPNIVETLPPTIKIGAITDDPTASGLEAIVRKINLEGIVLPKSQLSLELVPFQSNSYRSGKAVCDLLNIGVTGIFSISNQNLDYIKSLCEKHDIPFIDLKTQLVVTDLTEKASLYFLPQQETVAQAVQSVIEELSWKHYGIIYDSGYLYGMRNQLPSSSLVQGQSPVLRQVPNGSNYWNFMKNLKEDGINQILILANSSTTESLLAHAQQLGMMTQEYAYVLATLDIQLLVNRKLIHVAGANVTGFRLVDLDTIEVKEVFKTGKKDTFHIDTSSLLFYDGVKLFGKTLHILDSTQQIQIRPIDCNLAETWGYGSTILNFIKMSPSTGVSGKIDFGNTPFRTNFLLDVVHLTDTGIESIGLWNSTLSKLTLNPTRHLEQNQLRVSIPMSEPFLTWNGTYKGFGIDLLEALATQMKFSYTIIPVYLNPNGTQWDTVIEQVQNGNAHLGMGDLSITAERLRRVDLIPFMHHGIAAAYVEIKGPGTTWFSFLVPFTKEVWLVTGSSYVLVSILLQVSQRLSHAKSRSTSKIPTTRIPRSANLIRLSWLSFVTLMTCIYTAKLFEFMVFQQPSTKVTLKYLVDNRVQFGCIRGSTTMKYLQDSGNDLEIQIWNSIKSNVETGFKSSLAEGLEEVGGKEGSYAFLTESPPLEYKLSLTCGLTLVQPRLNTISYGIALPKNSKMFQPLSQAMLHLQESSQLETLKGKWWSDDKIQCDQKQTFQSTTNLEAKYFLALFTFLGLGCIVGLSIHLSTEFRRGQQLKRREPTASQDLVKDCHVPVKVTGSNVDDEVGTAYLDLGINSYGFPSCQNLPSGDSLLACSS